MMKFRQNAQFDIEGFAKFELLCFGTKLSNNLFFKDSLQNFLEKVYIPWCGI